MCFTTIIYGQDGKNIGNLGYNVLVQAIQDNKNNDDGYALRYGDEVLRTLSYYKLINTVINKKSEIMGSKLIHLHLRKSTNKVSEEFVHMWDIGGWYCAHNGVLQGYGSDEKNDSLEFFRKCKDSLKKENLDSLKELIEKESGYGVFLLTNKLGDKAIVMSKNKDIHVEEYISRNSKVLAISSDDIEDKLPSHFTFKWKVELKREILFGETEETIEFDQLNIDKEEFTYAHAKADDFITLIDLNKSKIIEKLGIAKSTYSYYTKTYETTVETPKEAETGKTGNKKKENRTTKARNKARAIVAEQRTKHMGYTQQDYDRDYGVYGRNGRNLYNSCY